MTTKQKIHRTSQSLVYTLVILLIISSKYIDNLYIQIPLDVLATTIWWCATYLEEKLDNLLIMIDIKRGK